LEKKLNIIKNYSSLFDTNKETIVEFWLSSEEVKNVFQKYNVGLELFKQNFAYKIFQYYIEILNENAKIGDCPVMGQFFNILKNKNVAPHELFMICTHFKRSLMNFCFDQNIMTKELNEQINIILDKNLEGVLLRYVKLIESKNELITEQQTSMEQYLQALIDGTIFSKSDSKGIITYINDKFIEISGYTKDELIGKHHNIVRHSDMPKSVFKSMWKTLKSKKPWNGLVKNMSKSGKAYYVNTLICPILNSKNELIEYISIRQDLTESIELYEELERTQKEIIYKMGEVCETRSKETGNHVKRVANYSKLLAKLYGLTQKEVDILFTASPMHDIGKVGIPDSILKKPEKLTTLEFEIMKTHSEIGYNILKGSKSEILIAASLISYQHHEKWDGTGYPQNLKGEQIHIYGRISAIADVFDALGSNRCYKSAWEDDKIFEFFEEQRAKHFDPVLIDLFFKHKKQFLAIRDKYTDL